jgi:tight adherence protein C
MKTKTTTTQLMGESAKQKLRYEKLYGPGDYSETIHKNIMHTFWLIIVFVAFFVILLMLQLLKENIAEKGLITDKNGNIISIQRPAPGKATTVLDAEIQTDSGNHLTEQAIKIMISPLQTATQKKEAEESQSLGITEDVIQHEIRDTTYQLNHDTTVSTVTLPKQLADGTRIYWVPQKTHNWLFLLCIALFAGYAIYRNRDAALKRTEMIAKDSVLRELPEFVNKLVLQLNAGLILNQAFYKIVSDFKTINGCERNYFYGQLYHIMTKCNETNGTLQHEIRSFAVRTGVVEFMRLSNIISDSMTKGSDLMTQLKMEGDSLWAARRKQMEEKGKLAETKLTFPLVILLLVLVLITIAPAMMEI